MKVKIAHPLISCICVTAHRPEKLLKAAFNYVCQNYPNKELVISYPSTDMESKLVIDRISEGSDSPTIAVARDENISLGEARNHAIQHCNGEYICIWDDDDFYHFDRIMHQFNDMQTKYTKAGVLTQIVIYDVQRNTGVYSIFRDWPGTLICDKRLAMEYPYLPLDVNEDNTLLDYLDRSRNLHRIHDSAYLYTMLIHGRNVSDDIYLEYFRQSGQELDSENIKYLKSQINMNLELK